DLFRASLQDIQKTSSLEDEIALCKRYLRIEQHRLGERLSVVWDLQDIPLDTRLPVLSIQPLLENAIYHGIEPAAGGGSIKISGASTDGKIIISIENPLYQGGDIQKRKGNHF